MYWRGLHPRGLISPDVTFLWRPLPATVVAPDAPRTLWLWVHPSAEAELVAALSVAVAAAAVSNQAAPVMVVSRTDDLNRIVVTGPRAHALLHSVLEVEGSPTWTALAPLRTPSSLPEDVVVGLTAIDPRIGFPRRLDRRPASTDAVAEAALARILVRVRCMAPMNNPAGRAHSSSRAPPFLLASATLRAGGGGHWGAPRIDGGQRGVRSNGPCRRQLRHCGIRTYAVPQGTPSQPRQPCSNVGGWYGSRRVARASFAGAVV